jgi:prolyl-tRNA editing enzyme YbaK/EbsC (Cys-tRNA(Pro) deacylase)
MDSLLLIDGQVVRSTPWVALTKLGVPPFGHSTQLRVFVDPDLLQYDEVWAAAGTWNDNFGAAPADIVRVAGGVVTDLKR